MYITSYVTPAPEAAHVAAVVCHRDQNHKLLMHAIDEHKANIQEIQGCVEFLRILKEMEQIVTVQPSPETA